MTGLYVGPARVVSLGADDRPKVQALGGACQTAVADWALPYRYEPAIGDLLMIMGRDDRFWVTGIVQGRGRSHVAFRGDATLRANGGVLRLAGDGGVRLEAPEVRVEAAEVDRDAGQVIERTAESDSEVTGALDERVGECARDIDGDDETTAGQHETVAARVVKIDGALLRLS